MTSIPTQEPSSFVAGSTVQWTRTLSDYPASSWALRYFLVGPAVFQIDATASGDSFAVDLTAAVSATYPAGYYTLSARVTSGVQSFSIPVSASLVRVFPDPSSGVVADQRSFAARTLEAVEGAIISLAGKTASSVSVNGQSYTLQDLDKLLRLRGLMRDEVRNEEAAANMAGGASNNRLIKVRFGIPR